MATGIALSVREFPSEILSSPEIQRRIYGRGGEDEVRFWSQDRLPCLAVWHGQQFILASWGIGYNRRSGLPRCGWVWREDIGRDWTQIETHKVVIPANAGFENGVWYRIRQGIEGMLVYDKHEKPVVYMLVDSASHYFRTMTRSSREPVLVGETI